MQKNIATAQLRILLREKKITQEHLADLLGKAQPVISEILSGKRLISPEIAIDLELALGSAISAEQILNLQTKYLLDLARLQNNKNDEMKTKLRLNEEFPVNELEKRGWIPKSNNADEKVTNILKFARNSVNLDQLTSPFESVVLARQSSTLGYLSPSSKGSRAWLYRVRELAEITPVKPYDHETFVTKGMEQIRSLARTARGVAEVPQVLASYGVRLVIVEHLEKTKLDGAAMWLDSEKVKYPVIALTLRLGKIDSFWFNLAHELQHICLKHDFSLDSEKDAEYESFELSKIESEADEKGKNWLIDKNRLEAFVSRRNGIFSDEIIMAFAELVNLHPGVIVGILQYDKHITYSRFAKFKVDVKNLALMSSMSDGFGKQAINVRR